MKRCSECRRDYHDETLLYCLEDDPRFDDMCKRIGLS